MEHKKHNLQAGRPAQERLPSLFLVSLCALTCHVRAYPSVHTLDRVCPRSERSVLELFDGGWVADAGVKECWSVRALVSLSPCINPQLLLKIGSPEERAVRFFPRGPPNQPTEAGVAGTRPPLAPGTARSVRWAMVIVWGSCTVRVRICLFGGVRSRFQCENQMSSSLCTHEFGFS